MAIQHRHGDFKDFDPNKMVTAELAVVTSGDPASPTGRTLYICFAPGVVKRIVSYEDFENELQNATEEIQQAFTQEIRTAITNSIAATNAANEAKEAADLAAEAARKAAEAAGAYVLGDISGKTVKFTEAETRENINTGESTATMFGKIKKWFTDLKNVAFTGDYSDLENVPEIVNNRTTTAEGTVLDGRQGKDIQDELNKLNTKSQIYDLTGWTHIPAGNYNAGEQRFVKQGVVFRDLIFVLQNGDAFEYVEICSPFGHLPDSYFKFQTTKGAASIFVAASIGTIDLRFMPMDVRQVFYRI